MQELAEDGTLPRTALVWRTGMQDWVTFNSSELAVGQYSASPPPLSSKGIANGFIWALALAPVWGEFLHYVLAAAYVRAKFGTPGIFGETLLIQNALWQSWYFSVGLNIGLAGADQQALKSAGWKSKSLSSWLILLIPVYIYKRDQLVGANMTRFWIWIGAMAVAVFLI